MPARPGRCAPCRGACGAARQRHAPPRDTDTSTGETSRAWNPLSFARINYGSSDFHCAFSLINWNRETAMHRHDLGTRSILVLLLGSCLLSGIAGADSGAEL